MKTYGITIHKINEGEVDFHIENLKIKGFSIAQKVLSEDNCDSLIIQLENVYQGQEQRIGEEMLSKINELNIARMPFMENSVFFDLFLNDLVVEITEKIIGKAFQLHLQNGIINKPQKDHHQSSWHRDLPYQEWVISKPLAVNAFYCLSDFTANNGATYVLPYSHRSDNFPSSEFVKENEIQLIAPKGAIIFFDSMLYHRAGINSSEKVRYGVNNMFVVPIIKQQIDIATHFSQPENKQTFDTKTAQILGLNYQIPISVDDFRNNRLKK